LFYFKHNFSNKNKNNKNIEKLVRRRRAIITNDSNECATKRSTAATSTTPSINNK